MTVDDWLRELKEQKALPYDERRYPTLGADAHSLWGVFRDWLTDQDEVDLVSLVDLIRKKDGGLHRGPLRPRRWQDNKYGFYCDCRDYLTVVESDVSSHLVDGGRTLVFNSLLEAFVWLFGAVKARGFACK